MVLPPRTRLRVREHKWSIRRRSALRYTPEEKSIAGVIKRYAVGNYELNQVDGGIVASLLRVDAALRYLPEEGAIALSRGHLTLLRAELDARIALWQRRQAEQPTVRPAAHLVWPLQAGAIPPMATAITA